MIYSPTPHNKDPRSLLKSLVDSRRNFFIRIIRVIPTMMGFSLFFPLLGYVTTPAVARETDVWTPTGIDPSYVSYASHLTPRTRLTAFNLTIFLNRQIVSSKEPRERSSIRSCGKVLYAPPDSYSATDIQSAPLGCGHALSG